MSLASPPPLTRRCISHRLLRQARITTGVDIGHALIIRAVLGVDPLVSDHAKARGDATPGDLIPSVAEQCLGIAGIRNIAAPHVGALGGLPLLP